MFSIPSRSNLRAPISQLLRSNEGQLGGLFRRGGATQVSPVQGEQQSLMPRPFEQLGLPSSASSQMRRIPRD